MIEFLAIQVRLGSITLEQVPELYREQVAAKLAGEGGTAS